MGFTLKRRAPLWGLVIILQLVVLGVSVSPATATADPDSADSASASRDNFSADLMNLNYYPHIGKGEFTPRVSTEFHDFSQNSNGGSTTIEHNMVAADFRYGFYDRWTVMLTDSLLWDQNLDSISAAGGESEASSKGLANPTLAAFWRFWEDSDRGFSWDLGINLSPSLGPKMNGDGAISQDGNNLSGSPSAGASLALRWRQDFNELSLVAGATFIMQGLTIAPVPANNVTTMSYWSNSLTVNERIHFGSQIFFEGGGVGNFSYKTDQVTGVSPAKTSTLRSPFFINPHVMLGYRAAGDVVLTINMLWHDATTSLQGPTGAIVSTKNSSLVGTFGILHSI